MTQDTDNVISVSIPLGARNNVNTAHFAAVVGVPANQEVEPSSAWRAIVGRYDVATIGGAEIVMFANDLTSVGVQAKDALAVSWPITRRNLLQKIGRPEAAPKIDDWADVLRHHRAQRNLARSRRNFVQAVHIERLIKLAADLSAAAKGNFR